MKFSCNREILLKEISIAQEILSSKNAISIFSNILIETGDDSLIIKATDRNVNFQTEIPVTVFEKGSTTVFGDKFFGFLNSINSEEIEFSQSDNNAVIKPTTANKPKCELKIIASDNYPSFPVSSSPFFEMPIKDLREMIQQTIFAVSDDETRYYMNGIFFEKSENDLNMVSTDGRRLALIKKPAGKKINEFKGVIIPPKVLSLIFKKSGDEGLIEISINDKSIFFNFASYKFSSILIEGTFPNYRNVIPQNQENSLSVKKDELLDSLRRVSFMVEKKSHRVYLGISPGKMEVYSEKNENGAVEDEIPCSYDGENIVIALNYSYLEDPLKVITEKEVQFKFSGATKAITIHPIPESDFFHIVMPMQS